MPSTIRISDPGGVQDLWVEKPFLTFGSGANCDIHIDQEAIAPMAGNVRFHNGQFSLFNQSQANLTVNGKAVARGTSVPLVAGARVSVSDDVELELIVTGDPAPSRRSLAVATKREAPPPKDASTDEEAAESEAVGEASKPPVKGHKKVEAIQLCVILGCVVGCIAMLMAGNQKEQAQGAVSHSNLTELVEAGAEKSDKESDQSFELKQSLIRQLQFAAFCAKNNDLAQAHAKFDRIKMYLASLDPSEDSKTNLLTDKTFEANLREYVEGQLAKLPPPPE